MRTKLIGICQQAGLYIFYGLLAYVPFHILISTVIGVNLGGFELMKVLKDIVLVVGFALTFTTILNKLSIRALFTHKIVYVILVYALITMALPFFREPEMLAEIIGVVYNLRFLLFFVYGLMLVQLHDPKTLQRTALRIVVLSGVIVAGFGVIQYLVLPDGFFTALGYSKANGVLPAFYIDDKPDFERIMSTVRDPNSLGSYLLIITSLLMALLVRVKRANKKMMLGGMLGLVLLATLLTFSRSAWLGTFTAAVVFGAGYIASRYKVHTWIKAHKQLVVVGVAIVVAVAGLFYSARNTYFIQNVIFHADESTVQEDPNELRLLFWRNAIEDIKDNPVGYGPGSSGFSSIKNEKQQVIFTENYYLQIGREVGIIGILLFLTIIGWIAYRLGMEFIRTRNLLVLGLVASFSGLAVSNLFAHIWFNETVAYTWWGLASLYVISPVLINRSKTDKNKRASSLQGR